MFPVILRNRKKSESDQMWYLQEGAVHNMPLEQIMERLKFRKVDISPDVVILVMKELRKRERERREKID
jgi:hypothetical protein